MSYGRPLDEGLRATPRGVPRVWARARLEAARSRERSLSGPGPFEGPGALRFGCLAQQAARAVELVLLGRARWPPVRAGLVFGAAQALYLITDTRGCARGFLGGRGLLL